MNNKKTIIKNILSSFIYQAITIVYGFIVPVMIIKKFGSEVNGLISSIAQFLAYISLLEGGIGPVIKNALYKPLVEKNKEEVGNILGKANLFFKRISYVLLAYILFLCVIYPRFINNNYSYLYTVSLILIIAIGYFSEYYLGMTYNLFLKSDQKNYFIDNINSIGYIVNLLVIVILIKLNCNIQCVKLAGSIIYVIKPIIMRMYFNKKYNYKINNNSTYKFDKQWDGLIHHIASTVQSSIDVILLTIFSNLTNISIYSVYALITNGIRALIVSLTNGIDAFFGKTLITQNSEQVRHKFSLYSFIFYTLTTILLASTLILIVPFVSVYTKNFVDANYVIPTFAYILVFAEFFFVIRYPYSTIVYAKGHFKETKIFSIIEPVVNIIISVLLVKKYGLVGVAIGTLISMPIRTFGFIYYGSTKILETKFINSLKIIIVSFIEMVIVMLFQIFCININIDTYIKWVTLAVITVVVITVFVLLVNTILFRNDFNDIIKMIRERKNSNEK